MKRKVTLALTTALTAAALAACAAPTAREKNKELAEGPPVQEVQTPYDRALRCLDDRLPQTNALFAVAPIPDKTGKKSFAEGGVGSFTPQDSGPVVQSALFEAVGNQIINRTDIRPVLQDLNWGIRNVNTQQTHDFFVTGQVSSLDFVPGSGAEAKVFNTGPGYRQYRILVTLDLSVTQSKTGRVVANTALSKQVVAEEYKVGGTLFFGEALVSVNIGGQKREALQFVLREMLKYGVYDLLTQLFEEPGACQQVLEQVQGVADAGDGTA
jgi:curli biogenesis system outer membrane secretion channel CsgG